MRECRKIAALLSEYLDGDLPPGACAGIYAHLEGCKRCAHVAEELRSTVSLCRQWRASDAPGALSADKHAQLRAAFEKALQSIRGA